MRGSELQRRRTSEASTVHGMYRTREYAIWNTMIERCRNPNTASWRYYGGRGIRVAPEWVGRGGFARFWAYASATYQPGLSLDRIDPNGHYEPGNIRWIPLPDQRLTSRHVQWIETPKGRMCLKHAAAAFGINRNTFRERLRRGVPTERLFDPPDITRRCERDRAG